MVEGFLSLRSAALWHEKNTPGLLEEKLVNVLRSKSTKVGASDIDRETARALIQLMRGDMIPASGSKKLGDVDLEKGQFQ
jgi:hypothetical protein